MSLRLVAGAVIADRFCLVRPLGKGGMGEVWLARHLALEGLCAVKLIHPQAAASAELSARFVLEAKTAAQIRSAHVVQILDAGVCEGTPYIAMEHLDGEDLFARLSRVHVLGSRETAAVVTQVARALSRAHAAGIIHRDLKPGNLFLCRDGDREIVKVLDFGIAKRLGGAPGIKTMPDSVLGTLSYMSPEQAQNTCSVDHRCDLWALGVIAFRCLTGQLPFKSASPFETLNLVLRGPIPVPSQIAPVPPGFDAWWARAASRDPDRRFQSAAEMADALQRALGLSSREGAVTALFAWPVAPSPSAVPSPAPASEEGTPSPPLAATMPDTQSSVAASIVPVAPASTRRSVKVGIGAAAAILALGGLAALYVSAGPAESEAHGQASSDPGAPTAPLTRIAEATVVKPAETASAAPSSSALSSAVPPVLSAPPATARPREVVPPPPAKAPSASSARPRPASPAAPARSTPPGVRPFDPGF